jgi:hypothetical protein
MGVRSPNQSLIAGSIVHWHLVALSTGIKAVDCTSSEMSVVGLNQPGFDEPGEERACRVVIWELQLKQNVVMAMPAGT